jgi:hypothetical protein
LHKLATHGNIKKSSGLHPNRFKLFQELFMNNLKTLITGTALCAALFTPVVAEEIEIGGQIPPMAALVPIGGNTNLNWNNLFVNGPTVATATPVAKFFVNTNMPKWNIYLSFANGGRLLNGEGKGTTPTVADGTYPAFDVVGLVFDQYLNAEDDNGYQIGVATAGTDIKVAGVPLVAATLAALQSFTSIFDGAAYCYDLVGTAAAPCDLVNNWLFGTDVNATGVDIKAAWNTAAAGGRARPKVAGTYTELIYVTLATSY